MELVAAELSNPDTALEMCTMGVGFMQYVVTSQQQSLFNGIPISSARSLLEVILRQCIKGSLLL